MAIEKSYFRQVMGQFTTGVSVVTTGGKGKPAGITVNAFCSVSLDPPLVLVCIDLISNTLPFIRENGSFAVNILTDKQEDLSRCFAGSTQERYEEFCHAEFHLAATGSPIIDSSLAFIDARVVAEYPGGDHVIFLGQVEAMGIHGHEVVFANEEGQEHVTLNENHNNEAQNDIEPLAYYEGKYRHLTCDYVKPSLSK
jgi:flavin reductase (DIM6/NTAB) family NADH-FMN oxidoreductase RutF